MARRGRNRDDLNIFEAVVKFVALVFFLSLFSPAVRQGIFAVGFILLLLIGLAFAADVGFLIYRFVVRKREMMTIPVRTFDLNRMEPQVTVSPPATTVKLRAEVPTPVAEPAKPINFLERLRISDWFQFEKIVGVTYRKLGYSVTAKGGANPDGGIDLLVTKDGVTTAIQCKQWKTWNVGVKAVREFLGALTDAGVRKGTRAKASGLNMAIEFHGGEPNRSLVCGQAAAIESDGYFITAAHCVDHPFNYLVFSDGKTAKIAQPRIVAEIYDPVESLRLCDTAYRRQSWGSLHLGRNKHNPDGNWHRRDWEFRA